ncbi:MAG: CPBP family intramembrane metalloprotease [Acidobacteriaceae bacterium]|nr:CPBP family intramembrane metalloprotease [Acidobacteriaceae bacterium]
MEDAYDIQHDPHPAREVPPARRIPHFGHTLVFFSLTAFCILFTSGITLGILHAHSAETASQYPLPLAAAQGVAYLLTLLCSMPLFPVFWGVPFFTGIQWNLRQAVRQWWKLVLIGIGLSLLAQFADRFVKQPDHVDMLELFKSPLTSWCVAIFGSLLPAFMEEIAFRGFLLPSLATAYDWLSMERTPAGLDRWERTSDHSLPAWIFATVFSSAAFAALHGGQLHGALGPIVVLFAVSVTFSVIRIRTRSVAAAALVHAVYDALLFAEMAVATGGFHHLDKLG